MALDICKNHPGRDAIGHCETCHIPLCEKCAVTWPGTDSIFCSKEHAEQFMAYQERREDMKIARQKNPSILFAFVKWVVVLVVVVAILMVVANFALGMSPADQIRYVRGLVGM